MNHLQVKALTDLYEYRRKVKIALAMKKHPAQQLIWSLFADLELVKLMWRTESSLKGELEWANYEIDGWLEDIPTDKARQALGL